MSFGLHFVVKDTNNKNIVLSLAVINHMANVSVIQVVSACFTVSKETAPIRGISQNLQTFRESVHVVYSLLFSKIPETSGSYTG